MKRSKKIKLSRLIATTIAVVAFLAMMLIVNTFFTVTFRASEPIRYMAMLFTGVAFILAWGISLIWKSTRDSSINEMGYIELHMMKAAISQQIHSRNGLPMDKVLDDIIGTDPFNTEDKK